jgi:hypothetical protein
MGFVHVAFGMCRPEVILVTTLHVIVCEVERRSALNSARRIDTNSLHADRALGAYLGSPPGSLGLMHLPVPTLLALLPREPARTSL